MSNTNTTKEQKIEETDFEKQKIVYEKASELHRYYLSWRQFLFAGFIAVIGLIVFKCCDINSPLIISILLFLASITSFIFYLLDDRNSTLYHICQKVESNIEDCWFQNEKEGNNSSIKLYKRLDLSHFGKTKETVASSKEISHTRIIQFLYLGCSIASFISSVLFLLSYFNCFK